MTDSQRTPGVVLGPDGKPCKVCTAFRHWRPQKQRTAVAAMSVAAAAAAAAPADALCPPDMEQLGRATWTFLHTTAAYYPERPDPIQQSRMRSLLGALPSLYPCRHCAEHLGQALKAHPPDVSGRGPLSLWLCQRHNDVNERLGKPSFDCSKTDERWKDGPSDGSCDGAT